MKEGLVRIFANLSLFLTQSHITCDKKETEMLVCFLSHKQLAFSCYPSFRVRNEH